MEKSTKGAVAAAAAAVLLLGGAGSLAYWTSTQDANGGTITTGQLALGTPDCGTGANWVLDTGEDVSGEAFDPASDTLVPGDVITETCDIAVTAVGNHLRAGVTAVPGDGSTGLFAGLPPLMTVSVASVQAAPTLTGTFADLTNDEITEANDGDTIRVKVEVAFSSLAEDVSTQAVASTLSAITITATQDHS